ncbi:hypothetical protein [Paenarthrobacter sp. NPDC018779]|uniref:hypothetical protein n=1 Tax=Paenarthrobacter sp. NPDC018779 TaxID=3364375 RepID=UPI0037C65039
MACSSTSATPSTGPKRRFPWANGQKRTSWALPEAAFTAQEPADTYIALPESTKGFVWLNGFLLGRYWKKGPQVTLYAPAPLLRSGRNSIRVLELGDPGAVIELREKPDLGPEQAGPIGAADLT